MSKIAAEMLLPAVALSAYPIDMPETGNRLRYFRKRAGLTLQQLEDQVGSSKAYMWQLENKENPQPTLQMGIKLARAFGVSVELLFCE